MRLLVALVMGLILGCAARDEAPDAAYRAFARAVAERDPERTWALLSSDTRDWLDRRARTVAAAAPGIVPPAGEQLVLGNAARAARPIASLVVVRESRDRAVVEVEEEGGPKQSVELVREKGWRVRIPAPPG